MHHETECQNLLNVVVIRHPFITRLHRYIRLNSRLRNFNLDVNSFVFDSCERLTIPHLVNSREVLSFDILPDLCYIWIGEYLNKEKETEE